MDNRYQNPRKRARLDGFDTATTTTQIPESTDVQPSTQNTRSWHDVVLQSEYGPPCSNETPAFFYPRPNAFEQGCTPHEEKLVCFGMVRSNF